MPIPSRSWSRKSRKLLGDNLAEKNTGVWVYLTLVGIVVLVGAVSFWKQRASLEGVSQAQAAQPEPQQAAQHQAPSVPVPAGNPLVKNLFDGTFSKEVVKSGKPVLVDFWATWCGPCRMFGPIVDQVAEDYKGRLKVCRVDVDQNPGLSQTFQVRAIPTSILFKNGKVVKMWVGLVSGEDLKVEIDKVLKKAKQPKSKAVKT